MRTNKLLVFAAVALLIINGVLVYFLWNEKNRHKSGERQPGKRGDWFAEQLKLDSNQKKQHKELRDAHFESMKPLFDSISSCKTSLYNSIKESSGNDSIVNSYSNKIAELNKEITIKTYNHFKQVRTLLNAEQQTKYDELVQKMMSRRGGSPGKTGEKRKEDK
jgi:Spy/CpxP family protein refolding chaperone